MRTSLTYLASPYTDPDPEVEERRYKAVCLQASKMLKAGEFVFSPIAHCHPIAKAGGLPGDFGFWIEYDRRMISACDSLAVFMLPGWDESTGIAGEIGIAKMKGIPIRYIDCPESY